MADQKVTELSAITPVDTDWLYIIDDPAGTPVSARCSVGDIRGALKQLATGSPSAVATVEFTGLDNAYRWFELMWAACEPSVDGAYMLLQVSSDGGMTWETSGYVGGSSNTPYDPVSWTSTGATGSTVIAGPIGFTSAEATSGIAHIANLCHAENTHVFSHGHFQDTAAAVQRNQGGSVRADTTVYDAIRVLWNSGNFDDGELCLQGREGFA